ncbi:MAG TPA: c-type cytochrome [Opitutaceae bacterium]|nr:c-type cytochrome [Opitutaceae bacterium]
MPPVRLAFQYLVATAALFLCGPRLTAAAVTEGSSAEEVARGRKLFTVHCARCHGMHGLGGTGPSLAQLSPGTDTKRLIAVIESGIPGTAMPNWRNNFVEKDKRALAAFVRSLGAAAEVPLSGDHARGKELFAKAGCAQCHSVAGQGGVKGPDLTSVGSRRGADRLRRMLLEPGAEKITGEDGYVEFLPVKIVTATGQEVDGVRLNEDGFTIQLRDLENRLHSFRKSEVKVLEKSFSRSVMPSFAHVFNATELDDVVAYLASLRGKP